MALAPDCGRFKKKRREAQLQRRTQINTEWQVNSWKSSNGQIFAEM